MAKKHDWLVVTGLNKLGQVCAHHRWRGIPWRKSIQAIWQIVGEDVPCLVDSTGVGDPVLEELQVGHGNFMGYNFSAPSKQKLMEGLAVSIQSHEIQFPQGIIPTELALFEYVEGRTGVRYSAPEGEHDDCVMSLALGRQMWTEVQPGVNVMDYYDMVSRRLRTKAFDIPADGDVRLAPNQELVAPEVFENELEDFYEKALSQTLGTTHRLCCACGETIPPGAQVTDGEFLWHPACAGRAPRAQLFAEAVLAGDPL